ncbi:MAG: amidohydrolase family protein [Bifidobacteriaceae bacterium]|jgi:predicted TIM-barrel fold metal-dependent hydrolase|nr:amidohydrolase family protein [Bifidobacteriaceae bacterium]
MGAAELEPFVDSHVHFWRLDSETLDYDILTRPEAHPIMGDIDGVRVVRFGPKELEACSRFQNVTKVVHVQVAFGATDPVAETVWLEELARDTGVPHGIVGTEDLGAPDVAARLEAHAAHPLLRGLRAFGDAAELESAAWRRGYALLAQHRLVFHHVFGVGLFGVARSLAEEFPEVSLCVDQTGLPLRRDDEYFAQWRRGLALVSAAPNTVCKISSLGMVDQRWTVETLRPWVLAAIDCFGPKRVFFGSNFPMDSVASSYPDLVNAFRTIISGFSPDDRCAMLADNATRVYRLGPRRDQDG